MIYKLIVLPTQETLETLKQFFAASPYTVNWDALCVQLATSLDPIIADSTPTYRAIAGAMDAWYETTTGKSYLLMSLVPSPEMVKRHEEIGDAWNRLFVPYMNLIEDPILRRERKAWINSLSNAFVDRPLVMTFHNELVVESDQIAPDQMDFYTDYAKRGQVPVRVFTDDTR